MEDEDKRVYRWEQMDQTWDSVQEDEHGNIVEVSSERQRSHKAKSNRITLSIRRGLIRYLVVALDCSQSATERDFRPTRLEVCKGGLQKFIGEFFDQNPISQLSLIMTKDRIAEKCTDLSGNSKAHIEKLQNVAVTKGVASIQNTIELAMSNLRHIPNYGHRELLIVYSSLSTCDPGDIFTTLKSAILMKLRISVISLVSEIYVCKAIAEQTGGTCTVALDAQHFLELLMIHTAPPPQEQQLITGAENQQELLADLIYIGFPKRTFDFQPLLGFEGKKMKFSETSYVCPRCHTRTTDIPTQCCVCGLQLNSSSHIARSHHHLYPVPNFMEHTVTRCDHQKLSSSTGGNFILMPTMEAPTTENTLAAGAFFRPLHVPTILTDEMKSCTGCFDSFLKNGKMAMKCPACQNFFCVDCDLFIHDSLHNCPACIK